MKEFEMPEMPVEETEELDLLSDMPEGEGEEVSPLADFADDELIDELKKRGFEIEEPSEEAEEMPEEEVETDVEMEM